MSCFKEQICKTRLRFGIKLCWCLNGWIYLSTLIITGKKLKVLKDTNTWSLSINNWAATVSWAFPVHLATTCCYDTLQLLPRQLHDQVSSNTKRRRLILDLCYKYPWREAIHMARGFIVSKIYQIQQIKRKHQEMRYREQSDACFRGWGMLGVCKSATSILL